MYTFHISSSHTITNKLILKVLVQKKGKKSYESYKYVFKFRWFHTVKNKKMQDIFQTLYF